MSPLPSPFRHPRCPHSRLGSRHCHSRKRPQADCHQAAKPGDCGVQCALKRCAQRRARMLQACRQCRCGASRAGLPSLGRSPRRVGVSGTRSRGPPIHGFPQEACSSHLSAHAQRTGTLTPLRAQSVRFPFGRPVPSSCRAPSLSRARVGSRVAPSGSASNSHHLYCALWLVHSLLDFVSRFERIFTNFGIGVVTELRRS